MTAVVDRISAWRQRLARRDERRLPRASPRRRWLVGLVVGGWALFCGTQLALAYRDVQGGMHEAAAARRVMGRADFDQAQAEGRLDRARRSFRHAHRGASSPVLAPLRVVPVLGRQLRSFADLTHSAARVTGVAAASAEAVGAVLGDVHRSGPDRVTTLRLLADRAATADTALGDVRLRGGDGLLPPLRRHWAALEHEVTSIRATLRTASEGLAGVAEVLDGPRRYLLLAANNAEMRGGSGMFLSIGTIGTAGGSVKVGRLRPAGDLTLPGSGVPAEGDLQSRWGWLEPGREWRNLASTPRFDATAPLAVDMWERLTGEQLDGALALDVPLLAAILGATGPVAVGDGLVSETTVADRLLRDQYQGLDVHDSQSERRDELGAIVAAVVGVLEKGDYSPWQLAASLAEASRGRHVLAWSAHPREQRMWETAGIAGSLESRSLAVSILNRGGNKLDPFLDVETALELHSTSDETEVTVRVKVANDAPPGLSPYIAGPHPRSGVAEGDYLGVVAVNVPGAATYVAIDGAGAPISFGPDGPTQVVAAPLLVGRGQETTVTVQFRLPASERSIETVPSARVPAMVWEAGGHRWRDNGPKVVSWP